MAQFLVKFIGHIVSKRGKLPAEIYHTLITEVPGAKELDEEYRKQMKAFIANGGMHVFKNPLIHTVTVADNTIFVPMHMIEFIDSEVTRLGGDIQDPTDPRTVMQ
jgi:hypothetical protein